MNTPIEKLKELWDFTDEDKFYETLEQNLDNYDFWKYVQRYLNEAMEVVPSEQDK